MQNLVITLLLAASTAIHPVTQSPNRTAALTCQIRQHRTGLVCWCKRPGGRWQVYPMIACRIAVGV